MDSQRRWAACEPHGSFYSSRGKAKTAKDTLLKTNPKYIADIVTREMDEVCFNPVILP